MLPRIAVFAALALCLFHRAKARDTRDSLQQTLSPQTTRSRPNVIFFLTDDQDVRLNSLAYQQYVQRHLIDEGLYFKRHFCTVALCCPSRVNLWTGKAAHNTNVTDINPPYGKGSRNWD